MTVFEPRFPDNLSHGAAGGCGWKTSVVATAAGDEYRGGNWGRSLGRWVVGHNIRSEADRDQLIAFHRVFQGRSSAFRFKDWTDFQVGVGEGVLVHFPGAAVGSAMLAKQYTVTDIFSTVFIVTRQITKPIAATVVFSDGSVVDSTSGVVAGGTVGTTTWVGEFDNWVRFDHDTPDIAVHGPVTVGWKGISVVEHRLDPGDAS